MYPCTSRSRAAVSHQPAFVRHHILFQAPGKQYCGANSPQQNCFLFDHREERSAMYTRIHSRTYAVPSSSSAAPFSLLASSKRQPAMLLRFLTSCQPVCAHTCTSRAQHSPSLSLSRLIYSSFALFSVPSAALDSSPPHSVLSKQSRLPG